MGIRKLRNDIGKKIKNLRKEKGLSQEEFSECVGLSREHVSCIERGKHMITIEKLYKIAEHFKVDIKDFF